MNKSNFLTTIMISLLSLSAHAHPGHALDTFSLHNYLHILLIIMPFAIGLTAIVWFRKRRCKPVRLKQI